MWTLPRVIPTALLLAACGSSPDYRVEELHDVPAAASPRLLCVVAHPDDEIAFAGTLYKTATFLGGVADVFVITNGEGGFKYSTLAEAVYGVELTDEEIGRRYLPEIRARELAAGCEVLGVRRVHILGEKDTGYTQDPSEVLGAPGSSGAWDQPRIRAALVEVLANGDYDFVLTLAPTPETHGHHQAATILALEACATLHRDLRPVVMCVRTSDEDDPPPEPPGLEGFPITRVRPATTFIFDRTQSFGYRDRLNYRIVVNWAIAEHKSQGTMQLLTNTGDREVYFLFEANPRDAAARATALFEALEPPQFEPLTYPTSASVDG